MSSRIVNTKRPLTTVMNITMDLKMRLDVERLADKYDTSKSAIVRLAIEQFLRKVKNAEIKIKTL
jgi:predicted transcriptional regulator